jgi:hypothetical protein
VSRKLTHSHSPVNPQSGPNVSENQPTDDVPTIFWEQPPRPNQLTRARERIEETARDMGLAVTTWELDLFSVLLVGLEEK